MTSKLSWVSKCIGVLSLSADKIHRVGIKGRLLNPFVHFHKATFKPTSGLFPAKSEYNGRPLDRDKAFDSLTLIKYKNYSHWCFY